MRKFRKALNATVISVIISISFLLNSAAYSYSLSDASLRLPVAANSTYQRIAKELYKRGSGDLAATKLRLIDAEFMAEKPVKKDSIRKGRLRALKVISATSLYIMLYSLFSCTGTKDEKDYIELARTKPDEALMKFARYKDQPFTSSVVNMAIKTMGKEALMDRFYAYPQEFWEYMFREVWKNRTDYGNQEENQAARLLSHVADGKNQRLKRGLISFLAWRYPSTFLESGRGLAIWQPKPKWEEMEYIKKLYAEIVISGFAEDYSLGPLFWAGLSIDADENDKIRHIISIDQARFTIDAVKTYGGAMGQLLVRAVTAKLKNDTEEVISLMKDIWDSFRTKNILKPQEAFTLLSYVALEFVKKINDLHEEPDAIRFASVKEASSFILYIITVFGEEELYTSSFNGIFDRFVAGLQAEGLTLKEFFEKQSYIKFRTLIKMCAWYNRLGDLLGIADSTFRVSLLQSFIKRLEQEDDPLAEAVSVADAFNYIKEHSALETLQGELKSEYERVKRKKDHKAVVIYGLLAGLVGKNAVVDKEWFAGMGRRYPLPNILVLPNDKLFDSKGVDVQRYFFYNDEDGRGSFKNFLDQYSNDPAWKIENNKTYIRIVSVSGKRVEIYADFPEYADIGQKAVDSALEDNHQEASVIIHRGHSYYAIKTLKNITPNAVLVGLGSCGGYNKVKMVLERSGKAFILSTKGVGTAYINDPLLKIINEEIRNGRDIIWEDLWAYAEKRLGNNPDFYAYVRPDKNLGALFLQAYNSEINKLIDRGVIKDTSASVSYGIGLAGALGAIAWDRITDETEISRRNFLLGGFLSSYKDDDISVLKKIKAGRRIIDSTL